MGRKKLLNNKLKTKYTMAIRKVIHMGDIHIRTYRMHDEYREVLNTTLDKIKELVKPYKREEVRIVIAGDYVHQKITISNELLILGTWFLKKLEAIAPVVIIAGNHDLIETNKDRLDSITPMVSLLPDLDIKYFKGESDCYLDDNIVWCVYSIFDENRRPDIDKARNEYGDDKTYIGLFHGPIIGARTDIGYEFDHGKSFEHFDGCDMVMCGDIHKRDIWNHNGCLVAMPSSLLQQHYGENVTKHGFLLWDIDKKEISEHDIENNYGFYQFKIKSLDDIENGSEILTNYD
jgi:DNA repair exonuclease SbcCD nuclease subunit